MPRVQAEMRLLKSVGLQNMQRALQGVLLCPEAFDL